MKTSADIIVASDIREHRQLLTQLLGEHDCRVRSVARGADVLHAVQSAPPDLLLLDLTSADTSGYDVCEQLQTDPALRDIPVIFLSALEGSAALERAFLVGAVDYITRPFHPAELLARVSRHVALRHQRQEVQRAQQQECARLEQHDLLKDDFVRTLAHDLRNPLTAIKGYSDLLRLSPAAADPDIAACIGHLQRASDRMLGLITNLLDLAWIESGATPRCEVLPVGPLLERCVEEADFAAQQKALVLHCALPQEPIFVAMDQRRMGQVFSNLLANAIKYTPAGGIVTLTAQAADDVTICVRDTGVGIPPEALPQLFEPFYRVPRAEHQAEPGTGLGLAIVKQVVEQHGGTLWVESVEGLGSSFSVVLCRAEHDAPVLLETTVGGAATPAYVFACPRSDKVHEHVGRYVVRPF